MEVDHIIVEAGKFKTGGHASRVEIQGRVDVVVLCQRQSRGRNFSSCSYNSGLSRVADHDLQTESTSPMKTSKNPIAWTLQDSFVQCITSKKRNHYLLWPSCRHRMDPCSKFVSDVKIGKHTHTVWKSCCLHGKDFSRESDSFAHPKSLQRSEK